MEGHYIVSARKYRPMTFDEVVGQDSLVKTLKNAVLSGKIAHAYLFCGPRGVGKTTCARIFAKTINCLHPVNGEACGECESCRSFNEQRSYNIHELDAASNNLVDDIRMLNEQVMIPPQTGKYKVFIIDEVHMLTTSAFNAFLKTLEEPPGYAIFILATTEKHKILPTIISRCQVYDFKRMEVADIVNHLADVARMEHVECEPQALHVIAMKADGGMRDALSIFDQLVSFGNGRVTYRDALTNLNVLDYDYYFKITSHLLAHDYVNALLLYDDVLRKGFDGGMFIAGLAAHFRDLLVAGNETTVSLMDAGEEVKARYREQAAKCSSRFLLRAMKLCNDCDLNYKGSRNKRLQVELTLIMIAQQDDADDDVGSGRGPAQRLKPIANDKKPADAGAAAPVSRQEQQVAPQAQPEHRPQAAAVTTAAAPTAVKAGAKDDGTAAPVMSSRKMGISIKKAARSLSYAETAETAAGQTVEDVQEPLADGGAAAVEDVTEEELNICWRSFALQLPVEDSALSGRMRNMHLAKQGKASFEVTVDNELVRDSLLDRQEHILAFMQRQLHVSPLLMTIKVSDVAQKKIPVSRMEKYAEMCKTNAALKDFQQMFGLEFD
ncbi:MAG TPA: DNA polymerase III subunit gamma/tau [Candidatus Avibacteroides excrementipullorum]|jgi:DNA polymerase-3 subunit gamma/tau|nr:DNA polymerase III subunit gamma/tau [Candidatus Avibacteroides excrementipullorum]